MSTRREEIDLELEWLKVEEAFIAAKTTRADDPKGYATAKKKMSEMRTKWRQIREAVAAGLNEKEG